MSGHRLGVKSRLERDQEMSFIEFNYQVLQAYDFIWCWRGTPRLQPADGRLRPVGATSSPASTSGRRMGTHQLYALTAAADDILGRQDGQERRQAPRGSTRSMLSLRLLAVLAQRRGRGRGPLPEAVHDGCRWPRSPELRRCRAPEVNEAKKVLADRGHRAMLHAPRQDAEAAAETAQQTVRARA